MNIWITSDTHHGHKNIAGPKVSRWKSGFRTFNSVPEMNETLINNINKLVKPDDILYHLGDWSFGGIENISIFRNSIVCKNIHLILGNHDEHIEDNKDNLQDLFSSVRDTYKGYIGKNYFYLNHYANRVWPKSHKGSIHLYGHSHSSIPDFGKSMDVGVDSAYKLFGEYRPFHINEILQIMDKKGIVKVDHHG